MFTEFSVTLFTWTAVILGADWSVCAKATVLKANENVTNIAR
jgi:hypothetical protein